MRRDRGRHSRNGGAAGFTLVELLVVIAIIGLIISLVLVAAADGVRRAEERATQALITKLEAGYSDRLDALLNAQAPVAQAHRYLGSINYQDSNGNWVPVGLASSSQSDERRAQVIAQFDYIRAELPDVFFLNSGASNGGSIMDSNSIAGNYPLNFAAAPYLPGSNNLYNYVVPLGVGYDLSGSNPGGILEPVTLGALATNNQTPVTGMFGASFSAAGGIYKNLYAAAAADSGLTVNTVLGYDGVDNNNSGYIDEMGEVSSAASFTGAVQARLNKHTHKTARAEMLYAILVEGLGPLGSVFNRDEFTAREVQDTDGDGLPEFVDAWGEPLQFYRWPIYYGIVPGSSDSQKGSNPYANYPETRQLDPLDPNQLLVNPGWWSFAGNQSLPTPTTNPFQPSGTPVSQGALAFMNYFHLLVDPYHPQAPNTLMFCWDRGVAYPTPADTRRAYFSKFLVLSAGPDKEPGVGQFMKDYPDLCGGVQVMFPNGGQTIEANAHSLIFIENQASPTDPNPAARSGSFLEIPDASPVGTTPFLQNNVGLDDISNHNIQTPGTGVR